MHLNVESFSKENILPVLTQAMACGCWEQDAEEAKKRA
jgi:hypothetical protein